MNASLAQPAEATSSPFDPALQEAIEAHLSKLDGSQSRILTSVRRSIEGSAFPDRQFWTLRVNSGLAMRHVHVKLNLKAKRHRSVDAFLNDKNLAVPRFLGRTVCDGQEALLWEHVEGQSFTTLDQLSDVEIVAVASALARVAAATDRVAPRCELGRGMMWVQPVAEKILTFAKSSRLKSLGRELALFTELEPHTLACLATYPATVLTHNDVKAPNIILGEQLAIVDWDSASIGPHGASLRCFTRHGDRIEKLAAAAYVDEMARLGTTLNVADVRFVMRAQEIFWGLVTGVRRRLPHRIAAGLSAFPSIATAIRDGSMPAASWRAMAAE